MRSPQALTDLKVGPAGIGSGARELLIPGGGN